MTTSIYILSADPSFCYYGFLIFLALVYKICLYIIVTDEPTHTTSKERIEPDIS